LKPNFSEKIFSTNVFYGGLLFRMKKSGKNIFDKLFGPYSEKPPGPLGEGVQGTG
jgi:hypothetical protein